MPFPSRIPEGQRPGDHQLTVVVPTCQRPDLLARCLERLEPAVQGVDAEVIVTDDGSIQAADSIAPRFPRVRWTQGPRRGPAANRNHGASLATGQFIVFLDDDVVPSVHLLKAYGDAVLPEVNVYEGRTTCEAGVHSPLQTAPLNETGGYLWSCNMMVRAAFWRSFGGFDEDFAYPIMEDVAFRERLKASGQAFKFVSAAAVDHPPRRMPSARQRIRVHEAHFLYYYKYYGQRPSMSEYLVQFAKYSLRPIIKSKLGLDSAVALGSRLLETSYIFSHWRAWDRRYRELAKRGPVLTNRSVRADSA